MRIFLLFIALLFGAISTLSAREIYVLNNDWQFFFKEENLSDFARNITLPHTWNTDIPTNSNIYLQTTANYKRTLHIPAEWRGKRLFLRFKGVQSVADVFLNGQHIGNHHGGYTAFSFEITKSVNYGGDNILLVAVSNAYRNDVLPTSTDQNTYGGIYRDVELLVTEPTTVSPLYYGTDGVLVHQISVTKERVEGRVDIALLGKRDSSCNVIVDIIAPDGYVSLTKHVKAKIDGKLLSVPFVINNPELWSPAQPSLYKVQVSVGNEEVEVSTGFRDIEVSAERKFMINGRRLRIHGVNLQHDRGAMGNAWKQRHYNEDIALIREMGANAIRSVVGPHAQHLYNECDRLGVVAWVDIPFVRSPFFSDISFYNTPRFKENGELQLREIILQNLNHPSVVMWGIFSHLRGNDDTMLGYIRHLNTTAKRLDNSRPTVACSNQDGDINFITDLIVWQQSIGWERGNISDLEVWQEALRSGWASLRQGVCYGEGSTTSRYGNSDMLVQGTRRVSPRWQTQLHEGYAQYIDGDLFWGIWVNSMFDYGSVRYTQGTRNCGVVAIDHRTRKDAFYLYKSLWNKRVPTLHITGKAVDIRSSERQVFTLYSSTGKPLFMINGDTIAVKNIGRTIYRTDTLTLRGNNRLLLRAGDKSDSMSLTIGNYLRRQ